MDRLLIINADGFGFTYGINRAIFEVAQAGSISSISVNANFPAIEQLSEFNRRFPNISVGVHLNPSVGPSVLPASSVQSLLGQDLHFHGKAFCSRILRGEILQCELREELRAQVKRVLNMGIPITHLDSHKNEHLLPGYFKVFLQIAAEFGIHRMRTHCHAIALESSTPFITATRYYGSHPKTLLVHIYTRLRMQQARYHRMRMPHRLVQVGYGTRLTKGDLKAWLNIMQNLPSGVSELYCHPGYVDDTLLNFSDILEEREATLRVLLSSEFRSCLDWNKIRLVPFSVI